MLPQTGSASYKSFVAAEKTPCWAWLSSAGSTSAGHGTWVMLLPWQAAAWMLAGDHELPSKQRWARTHDVHLPEATSHLTSSLSKT